MPAMQTTTSWPMAAGQILRTSFVSWTEYRSLDLSQATRWPVTGPVPGSGPATVALLPPAVPENP